MDSMALPLTQNTSRRRVSNAPKLLMWFQRRRQGGSFKKTNPSCARIVHYLMRGRAPPPLYRGVTMVHIHKSARQTNSVAIPLADEQQLAAPKDMEPRLVVPLHQQRCRRLVIALLVWGTDILNQEMIKLRIAPPCRSRAHSLYN